MFDDLVARYEVKGLSLKAVRSITALTWTPIEQKSDLPSVPGVYGWFDTSPAEVMVYHGSGSGAGGLYGRLANQLRWRANQQARLLNFANDANADVGYQIAAESPVIRESTERDLRLYVAVARPATWSVITDVPTPENAVEWETFLYAASHLAAGRRSVLGGGAWENKQQSLPERMTWVAWDRLVQVSQQ